MNWVMACAFQQVGIKFTGPVLHGFTIVSHRLAVHPADLIATDVESFVEGLPIDVVACKQYSTDLQARTFVGQRFVRIRTLAGQPSVQMGQHSCANGLRIRS